MKSNERAAYIAAAVLMGVGALELLRRARRRVRRSRANRATLPYETGIPVQATVFIQSPPEEIYAFYRNFENLPAFMRRLRSVERLGENRWRWVMSGPAGSTLKWDAEIHNEKRNEMIAWRTLPGADVDSAGSIWFRPGPAGGTEVKVKMQYNPPAGKVGAAAARMAGHSPEAEIAEDLWRLKQVLETGRITESEVGTVHVQSHLEPA